MCSSISSMGARGVGLPADGCALLCRLPVAAAAAAAPDNCSHRRRPHKAPPPASPGLTTAPGRSQNLGNDALKAGLTHKKKFYLRQALEQYDKGLAVQCPDAALCSVLNSNRAHVNLLLGNFRNAYQDGLAALRHNDHNVKVGAWAVRRWQRWRRWGVRWQDWLGAPQTISAQYRCIG